MVQQYYEWAIKDSQGNKHLYENKKNVNLLSRNTWLSSLGDQARACSSESSALTGHRQTLVLSSLPQHRDKNVGRGLRRGFKNDDSVNVAGYF